MGSIVRISASDGGIQAALKCPNEVSSWLWSWMSSTHLFFRVGVTCVEYCHSVANDMQVQSFRAESICGMTICSHDCCRNMDFSRLLRESPRTSGYRLGISHGYFHASNIPRSVRLGWQRMFPRSMERALDSRCSGRYCGGTRPVTGTTSDGTISWCPFSTFWRPFIRGGSRVM